MGNKVYGQLHQLILLEVAALGRAHHPVFIKRQDVVLVGDQTGLSVSGHCVLPVDNPGAVAPVALSLHSCCTTLTTSGLGPLHPGESGHGDHVGGATGHVNTMGPISQPAGGHNPAAEANLEKVSRSRKQSLFSS
jgi:hypothetical protein